MSGGSNDKTNKPPSGFPIARRRRFVVSLQERIDRAPAEVREAGVRVLASLERDVVPASEDLALVMVWLVESDERKSSRAKAPVKAKHPTKRKSRPPARTSPRPAPSSRSAPSSKKKRGVPRSAKASSEKPKGGFRQAVSEADEESDGRVNRIRGALKVSPKESRVETDNSGRRHIVLDGKKG